MSAEITVLDRLLEISELFQKDMARAFDGTPLTAARVRLLWDLQHEGPSTQHALATRLDVSPRRTRPTGVPRSCRSRHPQAA
ncbi:MAG: MarR family transcriptional regulator [Agromyces sp.]|nr:MarR family transcriptional regulator [Agromyces sp.]